MSFFRRCAVFSLLFRGRCPTTSYPGVRCLGAGSSPSCRGGSVSGFPKGGSASVPANWCASSKQSFQLVGGDEAPRTCCCKRDVGSDMFLIPCCRGDEGDDIILGPVSCLGDVGDNSLKGVCSRLIRSVTSTSSPTRRTAPLGPAQAYCPNTGLCGNFSFTRRSRANSPYSCRLVVILPPFARSTFKLKQRTVRKRHRTETSCSRSTFDLMASIPHESSSYGSTSLPTSTWIFGLNLTIRSSLRPEGGNRIRASCSEAVDVMRSGAASANLMRCG
jgi:hypothetical protein